MVRRLLKVATAVGAGLFACAVYLYVTLPDVRTLAKANPTTTAFMRIRAEEARREGRPVRHEQRWVPYSRISRHLVNAVVVTEDAAFWRHDGIDLDAIRESVEAGIERGVFRGASTITQQLAKNLYLSESRDPVRKLREVLIARRMEAALSKTRILEIYLNVVEWGDGVWGAEAASRRYFGVPASALSREQAALLAGALINPRVYSPARPPARLQRRQAIILARMGGWPAASRPAAAPARRQAQPDGEAVDPGVVADEPDAAADGPVEPPSASRPSEPE